MTVRKKRMASHKRSPAGEPSAHEHLRFEKMLADISARFVKTLPDELDKEIDDALYQVLEFFQVDRCGLLSISPDRAKVFVTHAAYSEGMEQVSGDIDLAARFPWSYEQLVMHHQNVISARIEDLPDSAVQDRAHYLAMGIRSFLHIPLVLGGRVVSIIALNAMRTQRIWPDEYIPRLRLLGEIFVNALERRNTVRILREREARLALATEAAGAMPWTVEIGSGRLWTTDKAREYFGLPLDTDITFENFLFVVHPEDREKVRRVAETTMRSGTDNAVEYRIVDPGGSIRWVVSRGRVLPASRGEAARLIGISADITERKQAEENLESNRLEIQRLAGKLITSREEEMRRLSRELHDDLTQRLAALAIKAGKLELALRGDTLAVTDPVEKISLIKGELIKVSEDVHRLSRQLHPSILDDLGLVRAIESECMTVKKRTGLDVVFLKLDVPEVIPREISLCLYRIAQEGMKNVVAHSHAETCEILLQGSEGAICLSVRDSGIGFDSHAAREKPGLGLSSMRERVQLVRGEFSLESHPGRGTLVRACLPLEETAG